MSIVGSRVAMSSADNVYARVQEASVTFSNLVDFSRYCCYAKNQGAPNNGTCFDICSQLPREYVERVPMCLLIIRKENVHKLGKMFTSQFTSRCCS